MVSEWQQWLSRYFPLRADKISAASCDAYTIAPAKSGAATLFHNHGSHRTALLSEYDPEKAAVRQLESIRNIRTASVVILLGLGMGYRIAALSAFNTTAPVIIIEPSAERLAAVLHNKSVRERLEKRTCFILGAADGAVLTDELDALRYKLDFSNPAIVIQRAIVALDEEDFKQVSVSLITMSMRALAELSTTGYFGPLWQRNALANIHSFNNSIDITALKNVWKDMPVILVAAGPSLDLHREQLKRLQKGCIIASLATALPWLEAECIKPDVVFSVDGGFANYCHSASSNVSEALLITEPSVHPQVLRHWHGQIGFINYDLPLNRLIGNDELLKIDMAGTVAATAVQVLHHFGCRPMYFLGQDFAFVGRKFHCSHAVQERQWFKMTSRTMTAETHYDDIWMETKKISLRDYNGTVIFSDNRMRHYLQWMEQYITRQMIHAETLTPESARMKSVSIAGSVVQKKKSVFKPTKTIQYDAETALNAVLEAAQSSDASALLEPLIREHVVVDRMRLMRGLLSKAGFTDAVEHSAQSISQWIRRAMECADAD